MQNRLMQLVENNQVEAVAKLKIKSTDKEGNESEREVVRDLPDFRIGDTVDVHQRILEGSKERVQIFSGLVISQKGGGLNSMFTVRRIVQGEGVERMFPLFSPKILKIDVKKTGKVRRAKLYYMRDRVGKATRLKERKPKAAPAPAAPTTPAAPTASAAGS
jgi:large subunit ribosomal protein L19